MSTDFILGFATAVLLGVIAFVAISARHFNPPPKEDQ
jgi:glycerol uptake facilitator-like aquaporin